MAENEKVREQRDPRKNHEGYSDPTAYLAIKRTDEISRAEDERFHKLLYSIRNICELAGFEIEGRVTFIDKVNGRVWR